MEGEVYLSRDNGMNFEHINKKLSETVKKELEGDGEYKIKISKIVITINDN